MTFSVTEKLLVLLRDGRKLLGILRSFDQFGTVYHPFFYRDIFILIFEVNLTGYECSDAAANAVLEGACERVIVGEIYCDIPLGLYIIRGENVVLIGELV